VIDDRWYRRPRRPHRIALQPRTRQKWCFQKLQAAISNNKRENRYFYARHLIRPTQSKTNQFIHSLSKLIIFTNYIYKAHNCIPPPHPLPPNCYWGPGWLCGKDAGGPWNSNTDILNRVRAGQGGNVATLGCTHGGHRGIWLLHHVRARVAKVMGGAQLWCAILRFLFFSSLQTRRFRVKVTFWNIDAVLVSIYASRKKA